MHPPPDALFSYLKSLDLAPIWEEAARRFLKIKGVTLVLGGVDTGKSTLCRYLVSQAYLGGEPVALVDLDLGQSHLGPPGTLGLGLFPPRFPGDQGLFPEALYFIGQTSPVGAVLEVAVGSRILVDEARARGVSHLVVNTSGLIQGPAAFRLKLAKMELLQPQLVLALDREGELAPLLRALALEGMILTLPVSPRARRKTLEERRSHREVRFRQYFAQAKRLELSLETLIWRGYPFGEGALLTPEELRQWESLLKVEVLYGVKGERRLALLVSGSFSGTPRPEIGPGVLLFTPGDLSHRLVGLWEAPHRTLALGLILPSSWAQGKLHIWTPWPPEEAHRIRLLSLGRLKVSPTGQELPKTPWVQESRTGTTPGLD
jgi:polynucleotide 5'-hydroxyl-kinase GRC3/NOL9|uniref:Clp1 P-loop domain-containing protein n=1 Tax=Desulfobacca acetoxidans TaxID=60893 RepID=A0A7C5EQJ5_9BACT